jgi:hypothetical protein
MLQFSLIKQYETHKCNKLRLSILKLCQLIFVRDVLSQSFIIASDVPEKSLCGCIPQILRRASGCQLIMIESAISKLCSVKTTIYSIMGLDFL